MISWIHGATKIGCGIQGEGEVHEMWQTDGNASETENWCASPVRGREVEAGMVHLQVEQMIIPTPFSPRGGRGSPATVREPYPLPGL